MRSPPQRGECLPDVGFVTVEGQERRLSDYKGRFNLVLILTGDPGHPLLGAVARRHAEFQQRESRVLAIIEGSRGDALRAGPPPQPPFELIADPDGAVAARLGVPVRSGQAAACVTDRWAEVFFFSPELTGEPERWVEELLSWLDFVEHQCPECFPPEWRD